MPNGEEAIPEPEVQRIRQRLAELDQAMDPDEDELETEFNELQEQHRQITGDYYDLPTDRDI